MVDIVGAADAVVHAQQVADGAGDIVNDDMAGNKVVYMGLEQSLEGLLIHIFALFHKGGKSGIMYLFVEAGFLGIKVQIAASVHEQVAQHLYLCAVGSDNIQAMYAGVLDLESGLTADDFALANKHLAGGGRDHGLGGGKAGDTCGDGQLLVELIAAYASQVIALVKEQRIEQAAGGFLCGRLAGALALVYLDKTILGGLGGVLFQCGLEALVFTQQLQDLAIGAIAKSPQQSGDKHLALTVDLDVHDLVAVGFILQPCTAVGDNLRSKQVLANLVDGLGIVHAGGTDQLGYDYPLCSVYNEGALLGHQGEVAHEYRLLLHFAGFFIDKANGDLEGCAIVYVPLLALFHRVLGMVKVDGVVYKFKNELFGIVRYGRNIVQNLSEILLNEPLIGILLNLYQVGHVEDFVDPGEAHALLFAHVHLMHHRVHSLLLIIVICFGCITTAYIIHASLWMMLSIFRA